MSNTEKGNVREWLDAFEKASRGQKYPAMYKRLHKLLDVPSRSMKAVSIHKLDTSTKEGDNVIVPRKILSTGMMSHKVNIAALEYSAGALRALKQSGSNVINIKEMLNKEKIHVII